ncbi:MAG: CatB-related O-acetyltransferase [Chlorobium sp.]|nr:CatB-related O-acetyltransferase [Chlorobium sp.]
MYRLKNVHHTCYILSGCKISVDLKADAYCFIGDRCRIAQKVEMGKYVMFASNVAIVGADHIYDKYGVPIIFSGRPELKKTIIESDVWIAYGVTIMAGITIGRGSIIAANAVVTKNVPPYEIWGGCPARKIKARFEDDEQRRLHDLMLNGPLIEEQYSYRRH